MKQGTLITNGKLVMPDRIIPAGEVYIEEGVIRYAGKQGDHHGPVAQRRIDAEGAYIMPGLIDMHSDAIEKEIEPRPGAFLPVDLAFRELEKKVAGQGITTMYHSFSFAGAEWGVREDRGAGEIIRAVAGMAESWALIRNKIHLRFEITDLGGVDIAKRLLEEGFVDLLSFMDHTPGQGQYPTMDDYYSYVKKTYHLSLDEVEKLIAVKKRGALFADENIRTLSAAALRRGIPMASHDDDNAERVAHYKKQGVTIHEFPINVETAASACRTGNYVCVGAPNILRGRSTGKGMRATDAVAAGFVTMLCSDYYPPSVLHAVFKLAEKDRPLNEAVTMAAGNPAEALGLNCGSLTEGKWGDAVVVRLAENVPMVMHTIVAGVPVYSINYRMTKQVVPNAEEQLA
ncbi:alpha-D-ribose 1-methylphosphonate 5-triphosphate diphosphatase [Peptococcaceae bacterium CEB3]|nr:alpha-D-ribose 1-methylphosphonate 5-triphosphate diphosphatase [Peptococcaceae bacterium CEB3]